jgi:hypothetical protein
MRRVSGQSGSALVEAAILFPCLVLILYWSIGLTDVLVLKLKTSEAARFALWETTVWKPAARIDREVRERFDDLRSPATVHRSGTDLLLFPRASALRWSADVDTAAAEVRFAGNRLSFNGGSGIVGSSVGAVTGWIAAGVQEALRAERFDTFGVAAARVALTHAGREGSRVLAGGDLPFRRGGSDLAAPRSLTRLRLASPTPDVRPLQLVFDAWKAWPKPAAFQTARAPVALDVSPQQTYPEVEKQVAAQVDQIAFFGVRQKPWFKALESVTSRIQGNAIAGALLGGRLPRVFSTSRMDSPEGGPVTIRPVEPPQASFVPDLCDTRGGKQERCTSHPHGTQRVGDLEANDRRSLTGLDAYTESEDVTRYTVPYRINSQYWLAPGGTDGGWTPRLSPLPARLAAGNEYVESWRCRGYFFAGSVRAQEPDARRRYRAPCG